jgi:hypothetical protein
MIQHRKNADQPLHDERSNSTLQEILRMFPSCCVNMQLINLQLWQNLMTPKTTPNFKVILEPTLCLKCNSSYYILCICTTNTVQTMIYIMAVELQTTEESHCTCPLTALRKVDILFSSTNTCPAMIRSISTSACVCVCGGGGIIRVKNIYLN